MGSENVVAPVCSRSKIFSGLPHSLCHGDSVCVVTHTVVRDIPRSLQLTFSLPQWTVEYRRRLWEHMQSISGQSL